MSMVRSDYRRYVHRLKNLVAASGDLRKFEAYGISLGTLGDMEEIRSSGVFYDS
ncbi:MAG: hypothetical protein WCI18_04800 [Pseudomonadota bacterium]